MNNLALKLKDLVLSYLSAQQELDKGTLGKWEKYLDGRLAGSRGGLDLAGSGFSIGNVAIANPVISAPLAGISDNTYRLFASFFGSGLTYSEMITSYGLHYHHKKSLALARVTSMERPCAVQIFGTDPLIMAEAARKLQPEADIIDLNMGCPVPKILKSQSGGWLMQDLTRAGAIVKSVVNAIQIPVTVKFRLGWDQNQLNVVEFAQVCQENGAKALAIHGRTVKQGFRGAVNYELIGRVKQAVSIPVIVSGDINNAQRAQEVLQYTGGDGIMIGRSSKGSMWIFADILLGLSGCVSREQPDLDWLKTFAFCYLEFMVKFKGPEKAVKEFRKYLSWIFKGLRGISLAKKDFFTISSLEDAKKVIDKL